MAFTKTGKPWEEEIWVRGHRSRVHFCTCEAGGVRKISSGDVSRQLNIQVYILEKGSGLGYTFGSHPPRDDI